MQFSRLGYSVGSAYLQRNGELILTTGPHRCASASKCPPLNPPRSTDERPGLPAAVNPTSAFPPDRPPAWGLGACRVAPWSSELAASGHRSSRGRSNGERSHVAQRLPAGGCYCWHRGSYHRGLNLLRPHRTSTSALSSSAAELARSPSEFTCC